MSRVLSGLRRASVSQTPLSTADRPADGAGKTGALREWERRHLPLLRLPVFALAAALFSPARAEIQIERLFLPHGAAPSSFAIGLPGGVNFCFDPVRGGVNYAWTGAFLDLSPARPGPGKFMQSARLLGPLVYQESGVVPLRRGDPARVPIVEFTGYTLRDDAIEFRYTVDGVPVREEIRARAGGDGLIRRFTFAGGSDTKWWHVADGRPPVELKREAGGVFVLETAFAKEAK